MSKWLSRIERRADLNWPQLPSLRRPHPEPRCGASRVEEPAPDLPRGRSSVRALWIVLRDAPLRAALRTRTVRGWAVTIGQYSAFGLGARPGGVRLAAIDNGRRMFDHNA